MPLPAAMRGSMTSQFDNLWRISCPASNNNRNTPIFTAHSPGSAHHPTATSGSSTAAISGAHTERARAAAITASTDYRKHRVDAACNEEMQCSCIYAPCGILKQNLL
ncbi:hypothetical protein DPMN_021787 [Dreissena polymorpha]|uniref:Uncharacterized protein n=1 Tax=Dreissena polymorpha TaxID=45954 RepID=A0A9D4S9H2_DREPO|nr:hypothetical protein DPMN_021787 [Dreissena polymorpha]